MDIFVGTQPLRDVFDILSLGVNSIGRVVTSNSVTIELDNGFGPVLLEMTGSFDVPAVSGGPVFGTVTSLTLGGAEGFAITDISIEFNALSFALDQAFGFRTNLQPLADLINASGRLRIDASDSASIFALQDLVELGQLLTVPVTMIGSDEGDFLFGGLGDDSLKTGANLDEVSGADVINGSLGNDTLDLRDVGPEGFVFIDYFDVELTQATLDGALNKGTLIGDGSRDTIRGLKTTLDAVGLGIGSSAGATQLDITLYDTQFFTITGGEGADDYTLVLNDASKARLNFAFGNDFVPSPEAVRVNLSSGIVENDGFGNQETISVSGSGILSITGSVNSDHILGSDRDEIFRLRGGNDTLDGGGGIDLVRFNLGSYESVDVNLATGQATGIWRGLGFDHDITGIEQVFGTRTADILTGSDGKELLNGFEGDDSLDGGRGNDTLEGGSGLDMILGGRGKDQISGGDESDTVKGNAGNDSIFGEDGSDDLSGDAGSDLIRGGKGDDTLDGGSGKDILIGGGGEDSLNGGARQDMLVGGSGNDSLFGKGSQDTLEGGSGKDRLLGGNGNDILQGGANADVMRGGSGADRFVLSLGDGKDTIEDLELVDVIEVSLALADGRDAAALAGLAQVQGDDLLLDFGGGDQLTLEGFTNTEALAGLFEII